MNIVRFIYIFVALWYLPYTISAHSQDTSIAMLLKQCEQARSLSQYDTLALQSTTLIEKAKSANDSRACAYAYFYNGLAHLFTGHGDESQQLLDKAYNMADQVNNDSVRALVMNARAIYQVLMLNNNFVAQQFFFKSLDLAKKAKFDDLQYRVRGNLLTLSHATGAEIVLENAREVYDYGVKYKNAEQIAMGTYYMATYYYEHKDYDHTEKYLQIALDTYSKYPYEDIASVYTLYAKMLLARGQTDKAEKMASKSISLARKYRQSIMEVDAHICLAEVYHAQKRYQEAIETINNTIQMAKEIGVTNKIIACTQLLATNHMNLGHTELAIECLQKANKMLEEQATLNSERLAMEQRIMLDIEKKDLEAKMNQQQITLQQRFMAILVLAVVILLASLAYVIVSYRRRQLLYRKIVLQNSRAVTRQKYLEKQIELYKQEAVGKPDVEQNHEELERESASMGDDKMEALYLNLCRLMEEEKLYTEAQLTREKMAERLNTNRTYLTRVIKDKTGMNYLQFVNSYRINEAIKILSDRDKISYPLKQIWSNLGFSSPSTFYKLFQQQVGITPSTYRKQFLEVSSVPDPTDEESEE